MSSIESNLYVANFVPGVKKDLGQLSELDEEITRERQAWSNSGAAEELTHLFFKACNLDSVPPHQFKEMEMVYQSNMFGDLDVSPASKQYFQKTFGQYSLHLRTKLAEIVTKAEEHRGNYQNAIRPLEQQRKGIEERVYPKWLDFMSDLGPVEDFTEFLSEDEFLPQRSQQRPFLELLARRLQSARNSAILSDLISPKIVESTLESPDQETFNDFLKDLFSQKQNRSLEIVGQWLRLISYPAEGVDQQRVFGNIAGSGIFPADLRGFFITYIQGRLSASFLKMTGVLADYKPTSISRPAFSVAVKTQGGKHQFQGKKPQAVVTANDELPTRPTYELNMGGLTIERAAGALAPHDHRMINDLTNIMESLHDDPYGLGVGKLSDVDTPSLDGSKKLPLRRLRPDGRPSIALEHPNSNKVRVVFHTEQVDGRNLVVVHDILSHADFDRRYA